MASKPTDQSLDGSSAVPPDSPNKVEETSTEPVEKYAEDDPQNEKITEALVLFFANTPFMLNLLAMPSFRHWMNELNPRYNLPTIDNLIQTTFAKYALKEREKLKTELSSIPMLSIIMNHKNQLGQNCVQIKAQFVSARFEVKVKTLAVYRFDAEPSKAMADRFLKEVLDWYDIKKKVIMVQQPPWGQCFSDLAIEGDEEFERFLEDETEADKVRMKDIAAKLRVCVEPVVQLMHNTVDPKIEEPKFNEEVTASDVLRYRSLTLCLTAEKDINYDLLDTPLFRQLVKVLNPAYVLPTSDYWLDNIITVYAEAVKASLDDKREEYNEFGVVMGLITCYGAFLFDCRVGFLDENGNFESQLLGTSGKLNKIPDKDFREEFYHEQVKKLNGEVVARVEPDWDSLDKDFMEEYVIPKGFEAEALLEKLSEVMKMKSVEKQVDGLNLDTDKNDSAKD